jgi:hypothetical protein
MNSSDGSFFKYDKTFASDLYLIYKLSLSARVCISDTDRLLMFYLVLNDVLIKLCIQLQHCPFKHFLQGDTTFRNMVDPNL